MKTIYLIWKNPATPNGYKEISGQEFLTLVRSSEAKGRYFIKLPSVSEDGSDGAIVMETTKDKYIDWKSEKNHTDYLLRHKAGRPTLRYHALEDEEGDYGEEMLADDNTDVELKCITALEPDLLHEALAKLTEDEYQLIEYMYLSPEKGTERGYSAITGIPQKTINNRKIRILQKIKNYFES